MDKTTEIIFKKTLHFPTVCVGVGQGQGFKTIEVQIQLATQLCRDWETLEEKRMYVFTASAHGKGHWGQCLDFIHENAEKYIMPDSKQDLFNRIYNVWNEYHLNDLQAGTKKQTDAISEEMMKLYDYKTVCEHLKIVGLYEDRGYKYGHGWLCKEIPAEVVDEIMSWQNEQDMDTFEIARIRRECFRKAQKEDK